MAYRAHVQNNISQAPLPEQAVGLKTANPRLSQKVVDWSSIPQIQKSEA